MGKLRVYSLGLLTLLMLPLGWVILRFLGEKHPSFWTYFRWNEFFSWWTLIGLGFGIASGAVMLFFTNTPHARESFRSQIQLVKSLRLSVPDALFLSLCAGLGEEFLFRITLQEWVHPLLASIIFVAIHGYIRPTDWDTTRYGLGVLAFIVVLSYAVKVQGIWFCIAAHAAYDFVLFYYWSRAENQNENETAAGSTKSNEVRSSRHSSDASDEDDSGDVGFREEIPEEENEPDDKDAYNSLV